jgi:hypothetical protein
MEEHGLKVFENRVLRRIFGTKSNKVTGRWRKLHNEELHNLYSSPSIKINIRRWVGHVERMGPRGMHISYWWESQKEIHYHEEQDVDGWIILKWIF